MIRQMPMKNIKIMLMHQVESLLDVIDRKEVSCNIKHMPSPGELRRLAVIFRRKSKRRKHNTKQSKERENSS
jgi:hypothetical protein